MDKETLLSQRIEKEVRQLIGDMQMQIIVLREALRQAQQPAPPEPKPPEPIPPQPEQEPKPPVEEPTPTPRDMRAMNGNHRLP